MPGADRFPEPPTGEQTGVWLPPDDAVSFKTYPTPKVLSDRQLRRVTDDFAKGLSVDYATGFQTRSDTLNPETEAKLSELKRRSEAFLTQQYTNSRLQDLFTDNNFGSIAKPHVSLSSNNEYQIRYLKQLTGHYAAHDDWPLKYTLFVLTPLGSIKERIDREKVAKIAGQPHEDKASEQMLADLQADRAEMKELVDDLTKLLYSAIWEGRYQFALHLMIHTPDSELIIVFAELDSMMTLVNKLPLQNTH